MIVIKPQESIPEPTTNKRVEILFKLSPGSDDYTRGLEQFKFPVFEIDSVHYTLFKDLSLLFNYPSSYQLMLKFLKSGSIVKADIHKTSKQLNQDLLSNGLIVDDSPYYFYIDVNKVYNAIDNKEILVSSTVPEVDSEYNTEKITITQVFPSYGFVNNTIELKHSTFNCITNLSKYNYYKSIENFNYLPMSKLPHSELENMYNVNDYSKLEVDKPSVIIQNIKRRKQIGKTRKNATNIDPNTLELKDTVIPGQGLIQEFSINHVCKVPNYYITNANSTPALGSSSQVSNGEKLNTSFLNIPKLKENKISRDVSQLVINNDYENFNFNKYFYVKAYRGPGSGNYKDASLINRINKIPSTDRVVKKSHLQQVGKRHRLHIKGLVHEKFNKQYIDYVTRMNGEDYENLEMLHNTLQFNLLANTYRDISTDTWNNYYKFKFTDFEQLTERKHIEAENEAVDRPPTATYGAKYLLNKFNVPQDYREIIRKVPALLRLDIRKPLYFNMKTSETNNSPFLTNIDVIKLPNANSIGWDNLKKYHDQSP